MDKGIGRGRLAWIPALAAGCALVAALAWASWPTLGGMADRWSHDPKYSHGFLVPVFALIVLWFRYPGHAPIALRSSWWGLLGLAAGAGLRLAGAYFYFDWLDGVSLLPSLAGICMIVGGAAALRWAWPAVAFLFFMLPLPYQVEVALAHPLQHWATLASTYCLQTLGLPALAEGNIILIDQVEIGVLEACNGLGMLLTFMALSTAVALVVRRRADEKALVFLSAIPIALIANVARITATGVAYRTLGSEAAHLLYHDLAGWLMMPLALGLLWIELQVLARVFVPVEPTGPVPVPLSGAGAGPFEPGRHRRGAPVAAPKSKTCLASPDPSRSPAGDALVLSRGVAGSSLENS